MHADQLGASRGAYILVMRLPVESVLTIGKLGKHRFRSRYYLYVGSAFGPGGLPARLLRHARREKRLHWHIDFFLQAADLLETWVSASGERCECRLAQAVMSLPDCQIPVARFGASDCRCPTHLFGFPQRPKMESLAQLVPGSGLEPGPRLVPRGNGSLDRCDS